MGESRGWSRIEALFDAAWELPESRRVDWLRAQDAPEAIVSEVIALLDATRASGDFLEETTIPGCDRNYGFDVGERIGVWRIVRPIGRGGMGEVYEVVRDDGQFEQRAALKIIASANASAWQRFQVEREILARLDHPGIARMIDGGLLDDRRPYMVMEYVDGVPIDAHCERHVPLLRDRVALVAQVGEALAYAHGKLVVHRDLKPSNVLVGTDGRPRLIDFGVAHLADAEATGGRFAPLSLNYAAPEQLDPGRVSTATDIHGLAAVLYQLATGVPPRDTMGLPTPVAVRRVVEDRIVRLADHAATSAWSRERNGRALLADLDAIAGKAMQPDPRRRYQTAEGFTNELRRAVSRQAVHARRGERFYVAARWLHRYRWGVAATVLIVASLAVGLGVAWWQANEAAHQRDQALQEQARLEAIQQSVFHMFRSAGELKGGDATARDVLDAAAQRIEDEFARDPASGAPVLQALGELYFLITDYEAAAPLLQRLSEADPERVDPALIAAGRYDLAQTHFRQGDAERARALLDQAQMFWRQDESRWMSELVDSRLLEAQLLRNGGDTDGAIELLESALDKRIALSGAEHREVGIFHNNLGVMFFSASRYDEARDSFSAAHDFWQATGLSSSPDALNTLNNWGAVEIAAGDPSAAEPLLRDAMELRLRYYGPSAATAAALSNYGKLLSKTGRPSEALPVLRDAAEMGERFAGAGGVHHVAALAGLVEAELSLDRIADADGHAQAAIDAAIAANGDDAFTAALASVALAHVRARQERLSAAASLLDDAERIARVSGPAGVRLLAQCDELRQRYEIRSTRPAPDTATPSP